MAARADPWGMADTRPLLRLPPPHQGTFEKDLLALMATKNFYREQGEGGWQIRQRRAGGAFVTLPAKSLAKACDAVARFATADGKERPMPIGLAQSLPGSSFIGKLPREWKQVRQFLDAERGSFKAYVAWCEAQGERPVADTESRFRTALGNIEKADGT